MNPQERRVVFRALFFLLCFSLVLFGALSLTTWIVRLRQPVIVPKIIGLALEEAEQKTRAKGLSLEVARKQKDDRLPKNTVLSQSPSANAYLQRGQTVRVVLSEGPPSFPMPSLVGLALPKARVVLIQNRLLLDQVATLPDSAPKDTVLAQVPEGGEAAAPFTPVHLLVSGGEPEALFVFPDLRGRKLPDVLPVLRQNRLRVEQVQTEVHDDLVPGTILAQNPSPGTLLEEEDAVSFTVSSTSAQSAQKPRLSRLRYTLPPGPVRRLRIDVLDASGSRTLYNQMVRAEEIVDMSVRVTGEAVAQIFWNNELVEEMPLP